MLALPHVGAFNLFISSRSNAYDTFVIEVSKRSDASLTRYFICIDGVKSICIYSVVIGS